MELTWWVLFAAAMGFLGGETSWRFARSSGSTNTDWYVPGFVGGILLGFILALIFTITFAGR